jgi:hypothetical protein
MRRALILRSAVFGVIVSNGLTDQDGGIEGIDYDIFSSFNALRESGWIRRGGGEKRIPTPTINDVISAMKDNKRGLFVNSPNGSAHGAHGILMNGHDRDFAIFPWSDMLRSMDASLH